MKFYGKIGFIYQVETNPGIWEQKAEEHEAYGDILSNVRRWNQSTETVNDSVTTSNRISVLADRFLCEHMGAMRYVKWNGTTWQIQSVDLERPRAILTLGGVYNGQQKDPEETGMGSEEEGGEENGDVTEVEIPDFGGNSGTDEPEERPRYPWE